MIHRTAVIHPRAELDPTVEVGPFAVIDEAVRVGARCRIGPHVHLTGRTWLAEGNVLHAGCVLGDAPQDLKYKGDATGLRIGPNNVFREHCTVHRSNTPAEDTVIGSQGFFMAHSHVGHNAQIGDHVIVANGALIGGHVAVGNRAFISGNCLLHQFVRVGQLALMQGGAAISKDLPPYCVARGDNGICGLNTVGLRRAGLSSEERLELRRLYHALFRSEQRLAQALARVKGSFCGQAALTLVEFVAGARRGLCTDVGRGREAGRRLLAGMPAAERSDSVAEA